MGLNSVSVYVSLMVSVAFGTKENNQLFDFKN